MFCKNCGKELKPNIQFCPNCGTPDPAWDASAAAPKKGKKKWAVLGGVAVICIAVGVAAFSARARIKNFFRSVTSSPQEYYQAVEKDNMGTARAYLEHVYAEDSQLLSGEEYAKEVSVKVELGQTTLSLINMAAGIQGLDISNLKSAEIHAIGGIKEGSFVGTEMGAKINDEELASVDASVDIKNGESYFCIPTLSSSYLDLSGYIRELDRWGADSELEQIRQLLGAIPEKSQIMDIYDRYTNIVLNQINDVSKSSGTLSVGSISQDCTMLTVNINGENIYNILSACVSEMSKDEVLRENVQKLMEAAGMQQMAYSDYDSMVKELETELQESRSALVDSGINIQMQVYVDSDGRIVGRTISGQVDGRGILIQSHMPRSGSDFAYTFNAAYGNTAPVTILSGTGTYKSNKISGTFELGREIMSEFLDSGTNGTIHIEVEDFDMSAFSEGKLKGSFTFSAPEITQIGSYKLRCSVDTDFSNTDASISVLTNEDLLGTLTIRTKNAKLPSSLSPATSDTIYDASNENDVRTYLSELNFSSLLTKLKEKTGISFGEYEDEINQWLSSTDIY